MQFLLLIHSILLLTVASIDHLIDIKCDGFSPEEATKKCNSNTCCFVNETVAVWRGIAAYQFKQWRKDFYIPVRCWLQVECASTYKEPSTKYPVQSTPVPTKTINLYCDKDTTEGNPFPINNCYKEESNCYMENWFLASKAIVPLDVETMQDNVLINAVKREFEPGDEFDFNCKLRYEHRKDGIAYKSTKISCIDKKDNYGNSFSLQGDACTIVKCSLAEIKKPYMQSLSKEDLLPIDEETEYQCMLSNRKQIYKCIYNPHKNDAYLLPKNEPCRQTCTLNEITNVLQIVCYIVTLLVAFNVVLLFLLFCGKARKIVLNVHLAYNPDFLTLQEYFLEQRCMLEENTKSKNCDKH